MHCLDWPTHTGIGFEQRLVLQAEYFSHELHDAIMGWGLWRQANVSPMYPYSVSQVISYDVNYALECMYPS